MKVMSEYLRGAPADGEHFWSQDVDMGVVNVQQNDNYFKKLGTEVMPALMRKSLLWDLVRERAVSVAEGWLLQGVPHPDVVALDERTRSKCPYGGVISLSAPRRCALNRQKELMGNAMHWAQISMWYLYILATTRLPEP